MISRSQVREGRLTRSAGHLGLVYVATAVFGVGALLALKGMGETSERTRS